MTESISSVEQLVAARQARKLEAEDIVRHLKLSRRQLEAIEQGDWRKLPGRAFVRGMLRAYGRLLGVDVEPLMAVAATTLEAADLRPASSLDEPLPSHSMLGFGSGGSGSRRTWIALVVAGVLAMTMFFARSVDLSAIHSWLDGASELSAPQSESSSVQPGTATETVPLAPLPFSSTPPGASAPAPAASPTTGGFQVAPTAPAGR